MANEFQHKDPGATMTQAEYITTDGTGHIFDSQAQGDIVYASSSTVLSRLGKSGTTTHALLNSGTNNNPAWALIPLASAVTGTLPVANGGTGITSLATGVATFLGTSSSANLRAALTDETGTGGAVFATSPTLVTPALGTPASGVLTNATGLPIAGIANGTDGELITWNASGVAAAVAVGSADEVLTSNGSGAAPTFQTVGVAPAQANQAALEAETNQDTYAAPDMLKYSPGVAKGWCSITAAGALASPDYNISSIVDTGVGIRDVNFTTAFSGTQFTGVVGIGTITSTSDVIARKGTMTVGDVDISVRNAANTLVDEPNDLCLFGDQ
tara:strand:+ start:863 stop:1846 length:984 start_codon:yes stop_codon:yes gene_type:complete